MNYLICSFENINYEVLSWKESYVFKSFVQQGMCFHNFRLPSPLAKKNIGILLEILNKAYFNRELFVFTEDTDVNTIKHHFENHVQNKSFIVWKHFVLKNNCICRESFVYAQEELRELIDFLDEGKLLNNTAIVLVGLSGRMANHQNNYKIFKNRSFNLYDECLHTPLIIYYPFYRPRDIVNSVSLEALGNTLGYLIGSVTVKEKNTFLDLCTCESKVSDTRWDIYSEYDNCYGLRGPMFQYYCEMSEHESTVEIINQELYDLNNDYKMENDLLLRQDILSTQIIDLMNVYKQRIFSKVSRLSLD
jgi:hypothetical protein